MSQNHSTSDNKSHQLITKELVKEAIRNDKGENAEVLSWEIQDFTNKGDGYMSFVTSVLVKYRKDGNELVESYVAKLNPLRPSSSINDLNDDLFGRETEILSTVIGGMNNHLEILGLPLIKTPRIFSRNLEKEKEAFLTENLRKQGFVMHDRRKGQDLNHAVLVMEELGRFHASSLLLQETISPKTFVDAFEYFKEKWLDLNHPAFKTIEITLKSQAECAISILKTIPKYEKYASWLQENKDSLCQYYIDGNKPRKQYDVLIHGDCWTNNILFKYDEDERNKPIDVRFVDLQCARKASPVSDIAYFIYSSLNGDIRPKYVQELLLTYYQSFSKVLILARRRIPFTFKNLQDELEIFKKYGIVIGLLIVVALFVEGEEQLWDLNNFKDDNLDNFADAQSKCFQKIFERESAFKERFLSLFDDFLEDTKE